MVDTISDSDVDRMDDHVDPTDLNGSQIQNAFRNKRSAEDGSDLSSFVKGGARSAFANKIAKKRAPVREAASSVLVSKLSDPGANGKRQLYGINPETGRNTFVGTAESVSVEVDEGGTVYGRNRNTGTRARIGEVDLNARR